MAIFMPHHLLCCRRHFTPDKSKNTSPSSTRLTHLHYPTGVFPQGKTDPGVQFEFVDSDENLPKGDEEVLYCIECGQPLTRRDDKCPWCGEYQ